MCARLKRTRIAFASLLSALALVSLLACQSGSTPDPDTVLENARLLMLDLINEHRANAGVPFVELGNNRAAQIHAENLAEACAGSHWGLDGTKPVMRYSLTGGYQSNAENVYGLDFCEDTSSSTITQVEEMMEAVVHSEGHFAVLVGQLYRKVNLGLMPNVHGYLVAVQQFEGNYVEYGVLPHIEDSILELEGRLKNGAAFIDKEGLHVQVWYDPPPMPATQGQLSRTSCNDSGRQVASIQPLPAGRASVQWKPLQKTHLFCETPHDFSPDTLVPASRESALENRRAAKTRTATRERVNLEVQWIPASNWHAEGQDFAVTADLVDVLRDFGPGVYSIALWAPVNGETVVVSEHSIFSEIDPPEGYE